MRATGMGRVFLAAVLAAGPSGGCGSPGRPLQDVREGTLGAVATEAKLVADVGALQAMGAYRNGPPRAALPVRGKTVSAVWHLEFKDGDSCEAFDVEGAFVFNQWGRWADVLAPRDPAIQKAIERSPGLVWMEPGGLAELPPPPPVEEVASRAAPEPIVRGGLARLTGKGVIVAIVDSGIDFRHPDFVALDDDGRPVSRILWFWDTTCDDFDARGIGDEPPIVLPGGAALGTVYSRETLTADLRAEQPRIGAKDLNGHGTACAGIAAGNGRAYENRRYAGVAPEADLIAVRIGGGPTANMENAYLLGAICSWIDDVAGEQPCVVSCSYGGQYGGRDGSRVLERQLDAQFASDVRGRVLCVAAGNEGQRRLHAETEFDAAPGRIQWDVPADGQAEVCIYFSTAELNTIRWTSTGSTPVTGDRVRGGVHGLTGQGWAVIETGPGSFAIDLTCATGRVAADAYISGGSRKYVSAFSGPSARPGKQVSTPATCGQAITVGSYDFNDQLEMGGKKYTYGNKENNVAPLTIGGLSRYSNPGPRRMGDLLKPELAAPGQFHAAARSSAAPTEDAMVESSGRYVWFNGTSAATPYCAGILALMFQKNPELSVGEIRELLRTRLSRDARTGRTPNAFWGHGKLDLAAARALIAAVRTP